jgi:hypothetical protein
MTKFQSAKHLIDLGFYVFPIHQPTATGPKKGKPAIKDQNNRASIDADQIKKWWVKWPNANIGLSPAPKEAKYKLFIIDVDSGKHSKAKDSLIKLAKLGMPKTLTVKTPSGGYHLFFRHPGGGTIKADDSLWKQKFPGIDLRGDGTYVLAAGSVIDGVKYEWANLHTPIANLPLGVVSELPYKTKYLSTAVGTTSTDIAATPAAFELPDVIKMGERDSILFSYACSLVGKRKTRKQIVAAVKKAFKTVEQSEDDPFLWETAERMIDRAISEYGYKPMKEVVEAPVDEIDCKEFKNALKHCVLIEKGTLVADLRSHATTEPLTFSEWKMSNSNLWVDVQEKRVPMPNIWLQHHARRTVYDTAYHPGRNRVYTHCSNDFFNTFSPSDLQPVAGDNHQLVLDHIDFIFTDTEDKKRFLCWLAFTVRYQDKRIPWVPLIIGETRTGKGWFYLLLSKLLGPKNCAMITPSALSESQISYNEWLGGTLVWFDDVDPKKDFYEAVKSMVTDSYLEINAKYGKKGHRDIFCNIIATSNHKNALKLPYNDERWWIIVSGAKRETKEYYRELFNWLDTDGPAHFLHYLNNYDLSDFYHAEPPPKTSAKEDMIRRGISDVENCLRDAAHFSIGGFKYDIVSKDLAAITLRNNLESELDRSADRQITASLEKMAVCELKQPRYRINTDTVKKRLKLTCVRNADKWATASSDEVISEYLKALGEALA